MRDSELGQTVLQLSLTSQELDGWGLTSECVVQWYFGGACSVLNHRHGGTLIVPALAPPHSAVVSACFLGACAPQSEVGWPRAGIATARGSACQGTQLQGRSTCERHRIPLGSGTLLIQLSVVNKSQFHWTLWLARFFAGTLEQGLVKFRTKRTTRMA